MPEIHKINFATDTGLMGYYRMETGALTTDSSTNARTLTNNNTVSEVSGRFGIAADFGTTNTNKSLTIANTMGITGGNISFSFWVKMNTELASGETCFILQGSLTNLVRNQVEYVFSGSPILRFRRTRSNVADDDATFIVSLGTVRFHHIAYTYDGATVRGYLNGVQVTSVASVGNGSATGSDQFSIGARNTIGTPDEFSSSVIDDVAVFNRTLSAAEVFSIYNDSRFPNRNIRPRPFAPGSAR